jgi:hypothetical protein
MPPLFFICRFNFKAFSPKLAIATLLLVLCIISFFFSLRFTTSSYNNLQVSPLLLSNPLLSSPLLSSPLLFILIN